MRRMVLEIQGAIAGATFLLDISQRKYGPQVTLQYLDGSWPSVCDLLRLEKLHTPQPILHISVTVSLFPSAVIT